MSIQMKIALIAAFFWWLFKGTAGQCLLEKKWELERRLAAYNLAKRIAIFFFLTTIIFGIWGISLL